MGFTKYNRILKNTLKKTGVFTPEISEQNFTLYLPTVATQETTEAGREYLNHNEVPLPFRAFHWKEWQAEVDVALTPDKVALMCRYLENKPLTLSIVSGGNYKCKFKDKLGTIAVYRDATGHFSTESETGTMIKGIVTFNAKREHR